MCTIDRCENEYCILETPKGLVEIKRKPQHKEGERIKCTPG